MATTSSRSRSRGPVLPVSSAFQRSISPSGRFSSSPSSAAVASAFASSSASFSQSSSFFHRSASPTRVNLVGATHMAPSVRFATSPTRRHLTVDHQVVKKPIAATGSPSRRTCLCSPTTHPGSFRCSIHKGFQLHHHPHHHSVSHAFSSPSNRLNARRSAMTNSLVRIGTVEGDWVKRALAALIRPSSHQQRRRAAFQPRPSRLSIMSTASDESRSQDP
ncbi:hypothetical protein J5N97_027106 [Dioscorea zingiberensis]|uniref:Serine-rich protein-like protein n=1 Tax=Dioscorea zingiberensis TaxID=325984 RepID=A0A9D5C422_9LILI|nr:hypothetical protein J5N97_027073 [Dioscorea zingiberensis]KAJ0965968.1 hypothetical protein J5N97_027106 [Dioscorea zingiberensis]